MLLAALRHFYAQINFQRESAQKNARKISIKVLFAFILFKYFSLNN